MGFLTCGIPFALQRLTAHRSGHSESRLCDKVLCTLAKLIGSKALSLSSHQDDWDIIVIICSQVRLLGEIDTQCK